MKSNPYIFQIIFFVLSFISEVVHAQHNTDIRHVRWGFTPQQVKEIESAKPFSHKQDKLIYAKVPLANLIVGLEYDFNDDSLLSVSYYYYTTASITKDDVIMASIDFDAILTGKYGPSKVSLVGDIRNKVWLTPRTQISLSVGNIDKGWSVELVYLCRVCSGEWAKSKVLDKKEFEPLKDVKDF